MIIKNAQINFYKSIKESLVLKTPLINIFIGQNNSGKSNILDAIEFCFAKDLRQSRLYYPKADIKLSLHFTDREQLQNDFPAKDAELILQNDNRVLVFPNKEIKWDNKLTSILSHKVKRLNEDYFKNFVAIDEDYENLFDHPMAADKFKGILKAHFPKISATRNAFDINYENEGLYEGDRRVTIDRLGSGFQRVFIILLYIIHPDFPIILIDEPEIHLHPGMVEKLLWAMQNTQAGQILFTTHSPLFVTPITLSQVTRVVKENNNTKIFTLSQTNYNYKRLIQELNADNLEMFFADKVLLVEGVSDKLLIRGLIDHYYQGEKDIKVVQTHGKGNMTIYSDFLKAFQIPFAIVLDKDAIRTNHVKYILNHLEIRVPKMNTKDLIEELKKHDIFVFPNGDLEANYPRKYQREDSKSLNALRAARYISKQDYNSNRMKNLREIIELI